MHDKEIWIIDVELNALEEGLNDMLLGPGTVDKIFTSSTEDNLIDPVSLIYILRGKFSYLSCDTDLREVLVIHRTLCLV